MRYFLLILLTVKLFALEYDPLLLRAQASIFPKIMLLDTSVSKKNLNKDLTLCVVYSEDESEQANFLKEYIDKQYKNKLGKSKFNVKLQPINNFNETDTVADAYFIFNASRDKEQEVIKYASANQKISFGYNYMDFDKDILISLHVKEKTYIYLNKSAISNYDIKFMPIFYNIVKVLE